MSQPDEILLHKTASYQEAYDKLQAIMIPEEKRGSYALSTVGGASIPEVDITIDEATVPWTIGSYKEANRPIGKLTLALCPKVGNQYRTIHRLYL